MLPGCITAKFCIEIVCFLHIFVFIKLANKSNLLLLLLSKVGKVLLSLHHVARRFLQDPVPHRVPVPAIMIKKIQLSLLIFPHVTILISSDFRGTNWNGLCTCRSSIELPEVALLKQGSGSIIICLCTEWPRLSVSMKRPRYTHQEKLEPIRSVSLLVITYFVFLLICSFHNFMDFLFVNCYSFGHL